ncbi:alpha/beta fold hydrolase [Spiractinospora alimapuensis]|nr:alpha/beta fold hydrolase [Spiractinospora alimapuensis]QVQ54845.1 alpha/beta fold hydrolase [Spiractinospora alimapuensis]
MVTTRDGVELETALLTAAEPRDNVIVVASGFTGGWRMEPNRRIASGLLRVADVMSFDFRGHHGSTGESTVGDREIHDLRAVVDHLTERGYTRIVTVGFSMGASVAIRHAALMGGVDAVVAVSGPSRWYYRGTLRMRLLHIGVEHRIGRFFLRMSRNVRVTRHEWDPIPPDPTELAGSVTPRPLLVIHGDSDDYFPVEHAQRIHEAANEPKELWLVPGLRHGESAMTEELVDSIAEWVAERLSTE